MIFGNGVDIVEISRIDEILKRKDHFLERFFTVEERKLFEAKGFKTETIAANFAAKEAISKAFGTGIRGFRLDELEILRDDLGKPYVNLYGRAKALAAELGIHAFIISLSHTKQNAIAFVIAV